MLEGILPQRLLGMRKEAARQVTSCVVHPRGGSQIVDELRYPCKPRDKGNDFDFSAARAEFRRVQQ